MNPFSPEAFLDRARDLLTDRDRDEPLNPALKDQMHAANRDARYAMSQLDRVFEGEIDERSIALLLALVDAAYRRGFPRLDGARPQFVDLLAGGRRRHCDICETRAHRLYEAHAQFGPLIFRSRACVRCRRFTPDDRVDGGAQAA